MGCVNSGELDSIAFALATREDIDTEEPQSYKYVVASKEKNDWFMAMNEEMQYLEMNETCDLLRLPKGAKPV